MSWSPMLVPVAGIDTMELSNNHMWRQQPLWGLCGTKPPAWMNCTDDAAGWARDQLVAMGYGTSLETVTYGSAETQNVVAENESCRRSGES